MKRAIWSAVVVAQLAVLWSAVAQTSRLAGSDQPGPVVAVSPGVLDFGLVGVGRTKDLSLTVRNAGGGVLNGAATVEAPFTVAGGGYSLRSGQSQSLTVRYRPTAEGTNSQSLVFSGGSAATVRLIGSARIPPQPPGKPRIISKRSRRFSEEDAADFIAGYYSDKASYVLKPPMMDGAFLSICDRPLLLKVARQQPRHELAAVVLTHYPNSGDEEPIKQAWVSDLKGLGYQRVVFLRSRNSTEINGLAILDDPQSSTMSAGN